MEYEFKKFSQLNTTELYDIMRHRQIVLMIGQNILFHDLDGRDQECIHLTAREDGKVIGYARIMPSSTGLHGENGSFGRLSVLEERRRHGIGGELVKEAVHYLKDVLKEEKIQISAMAYLDHFYTELGFHRIGDVYQIEGIDHIDMVYGD